MVFPASYFAFANETKFVINSTTPGAVIHYSVNSEAVDTLYTGPFTVPSSGTQGTITIAAVSSYNMTESARSVSKYLLISVYEVELSAFDGCHSYRDTVLVDVQCPAEPPTVLAGADLSVGFDRNASLFEEVRLDGSGSHLSEAAMVSTPLARRGGDLRFRWSVLSSPSDSAAYPASLVVSHDAAFRFRPDAPGDYQMTLTASTGCTEASDTVTVHAVCEGSVQAEAGPDVTVRALVEEESQFGTFPLVRLDGSGSTIRRGTTLFFWHIVDLPADSAYSVDGDLLYNAPDGSPARKKAIGTFVLPTFTNSSDSHTAAPYSEVAYFAPDVPGEYTVQLTITDGCSVSSDVVVITAACADPPRPAIDVLPGPTGYEERIDFDSSSSVQPVVVRRIGNELRRTSPDMMRAVEHYDTWQQVHDEWGVAETASVAQSAPKAVVELSGASSSPPAVSPTQLRPGREYTWRFASLPNRLATGGVPLESADDRYISADFSGVPLRRLGDELKAPLGLFWGSHDVIPRMGPGASAHWGSQGSAFEYGAITSEPFQLHHAPRLGSPLCASNPLSAACGASNAALQPGSDDLHAWFALDAIGDFVVELSGADGCNHAVDKVIVRAECNDPPVANAGGHRLLTQGPGNSPASLVLNGSDSYDPDRNDTHLQFFWEVLEVPDGSEVPALEFELEWGELYLQGEEPPSGGLRSPRTKTTKFTPDVLGTYRIRLTVSDYCSASTDIITVTYTCNAPPRIGVNELRPVVVFNTSDALEPDTFASVLIDATYTHEPDGLADLSPLRASLVSVQVPAVGTEERFDATTLPDGDLAYPSAPDYFSNSAVSPLVKLFSPPNFVIEAAEDLGGAPLSVYYTLRLSVTDQCHWDATTVVVEAQCPWSSFAVAAPNATEVVWNSQPGSRFRWPLPASDATAQQLENAIECAPVEATQLDNGTCATEIALQGESRYPHDGEVHSWRWVNSPAPTAPAALLPDASSDDIHTSIVNDLYDNEMPFNATGLGSNFAGDYELQFVVKDACSSSGASASTVLRCNSAPNATMLSLGNVVFDRLVEGRFPLVELDGSASSAATVDGTNNADEAERLAEVDRDARTTRFEWFVEHTPSGSVLENSDQLLGEDAFVGDTFTGWEQRQQTFHQVFLTSTSYTGNLGGIDGADAKCQARAEAAGLPFPSDFEAVICDPDGMVGRTWAYGRHAALVDSSAVYLTSTVHGGWAEANQIGVDALVAYAGETNRDWEGQLARPIEYDEYGRKHTSSRRVFSGCDALGRIPDSWGVDVGDNELCQGWNSSSDAYSHYVGSSSLPSSVRYASRAASCAAEARLVCLRTTGRTLSELGVSEGPFQTLTPSFRPQRLGTYAVTLKVTDGCQTSEYTRTFDTTCPAASDVRVGESVIVSEWQGRETGFASVSVAPGGATDEVVSWDWGVTDSTTLGATSDEALTGSVYAPDASGTFFFDGSVLGSSDPADVDDVEAATATLRPTLVGNLTVSMSANDGCSKIRDSAIVMAVCNSPPEIVAPSVVTSTWNGTHFDLIRIQSSASDADGDSLVDSLTVTVPFVAANASLPLVAVDGDASTGVEDEVQGADPADVVNAETGAWLQPSYLGEWVVTVRSSDGCTATEQPMTLRTNCSATPTAALEPGANASAGLVAVWDGPTQAFRGVDLTASASRDPESEPLRFAWSVQQSTPAEFVLLQPLVPGTDPVLTPVADAEAARGKPVALVPSVVLAPGSSAGEVAADAGSAAAEVASTHAARIAVRVRVSDGCTYSMLTKNVTAVCNVPPEARMVSEVDGVASLTSTWRGAAPARNATMLPVNGSAGFMQVDFSALQSADADAGDPLVHDWRLEAYRPMDGSAQPVVAALMPALGTVVVRPAAQPLGGGTVESSFVDRLFAGSASLLRSVQAQSFGNSSSPAFAATAAASVGGSELPDGALAFDPAVLPPPPAAFQAYIAANESDPTSSWVVEGDVAATVAKFATAMEDAGQALAAPERRAIWTGSAAAAAPACLGDLSHSLEGASGADLNLSTLPGEALVPNASMSIEPELLGAYDLTLGSSDGCSRSEDPGTMRVECGAAPAVALKVSRDSGSPLDSAMPDALATASEYVSPLRFQSGSGYTGEGTLTLAWQGASKGFGSLELQALATDAQADAMEVAWAFAPLEPTQSSDLPADLVDDQVVDAADTFALNRSALDLADGDDSAAVSTGASLFGEALSRSYSIHSSTVPTGYNVSAGSGMAVQDAAAAAALGAGSASTFDLGTLSIALPAKLGSRRVTALVSDGCSVAASTVKVVTTCPAAPEVELRLMDLNTFAPVSASAWTGSAFATIGLVATVRGAAGGPAGVARGVWRAKVNGSEVGTVDIDSSVGGSGVFVSANFTGDAFSVTGTTTLADVGSPSGAAPWHGPANTSALVQGATVDMLTTDADAYLSVVALAPGLAEAADEFEVTFEIDDGCRSGAATRSLPLACNGAPVPGNASSSTVFYVGRGNNGAPVGKVPLSGASSTDPEGDALSFSWRIEDFTPLASSDAEREALKLLPVFGASSSSAGLNLTTGPEVELEPDVFGTWVVSYEVTDGCSKASSHHTVVAAPQDAPSIGLADGTAFVSFWNASLNSFEEVLVNTSATDYDGGQSHLAFNWQIGAFERADGVHNKPLASGHLATTEDRCLAPVNATADPLFDNHTLLSSAGSDANMLRVSPGVLGTTWLHLRVDDGARYAYVTVSVTSDPGSAPLLEPLNESLALPFARNGLNGTLVRAQGSSWPPLQLGTVAQSPDGPNWGDGGYDVDSWDTALGINWTVGGYEAVDPLATGDALERLQFLQYGSMSPASNFELVAGVANASAALAVLSDSSVPMPQLQLDLLGTWTVGARATDGCTLTEKRAFVSAGCSLVPAVSLAGSPVGSPQEGVVVYWSRDLGGWPNVTAALTIQDDGDSHNVTWLPITHTPVDVPSRSGHLGVDGVLGPAEHSLYQGANGTVWFTPQRRGAFALKVLVDDGCTRVPAMLEAEAVCPEPERLPALSSLIADGPNATLVFTYFPGEPLGATVDLAFTEDVPANGSAFWSFSDWQVVRQTCPDAAVGYASPGRRSDGSYRYAMDATNAHTEGGGVCNFTGVDTSTNFSTSAEATFEPQGVGLYEVAVRAFDGCNVVHQTVGVYVQCNPPPTAVVSAVAYMSEYDSGAAIGVAQDAAGSRPHSVPAAAYVSEAVTSGESVAAPSVNASVLLDSAATKALAAGLDNGPQVGAAAVLSLVGQGMQVFPTVLLNGSASWDEPTPAGHTPQPLRYLWSVVDAPAGSALSPAAKPASGPLRHPDATTNPLFLAGGGNRTSTRTFGDHGAAGTGAVQELLAGNQTKAAFQALGAANKEAFTEFTPDRFGQYRLRLTVHDGCSEAAADVVVNMQCLAPPVADAGEDRTVPVAGDTDAGGKTAAPEAFVDEASRVSGAVYLFGNGSANVAEAEAGVPIFFQWELVSVPAGSRARVHDAHSAVAYFRPDVPGAYVARLYAANTAAMDLALPLSEDSALARARRCPSATDEVTITAVCGEAPSSALVSDPADSVATWGVYPAAELLWGLPDQLVHILTLAVAEGQDTIQVPVGWIRAAQPTNPLVIAAATMASPGDFDSTGPAASTFESEQHIWRFFPDDADSHPTSFPVPPVSLRYGIVSVGSDNGTGSIAGLDTLSDRGVHYRWRLQPPPGSSLSSSQLSGLATNLAMLQPDVAATASSPFRLRATISDGPAGTCTSTTAAADVTTRCNEPPVAALAGEGVNQVRPGVFQQNFTLTSALLALRSSDGSSASAGWPQAKAEPVNNDPSDLSISVSGGGMEPTELRLPGGGARVDGVQLDGRASTDPSTSAWGGDQDFLDYNWRLVRRPSASMRADVSLSMASVANFVPDVLGRYELELAVSDGCSDSTATLLLDVSCPPRPVVSAGEDTEVLWWSASTAGGVSVELMGNVSAPADQSGPFDLAHSSEQNTSTTSVYDWSFVSVPYSSKLADNTTGALSGVNSMQPSFVADVTGTYVLRLTVTDSCGSVFADVVVNVLCPAVLHNPVSAASDRVVSSIAGDWVDLHGAFDYAMMDRLSKHDKGLDSSPPEAATMVSGSYELDVSMDFRWSVTLARPRFSTGEQYVGQAGQPVLLDRVGFFNALGRPLAPSEMAAWSASGVQWVVESTPVGASGQLLNATTLAPSLLGDIAGAYELSVTLTAGCGSFSGRATVEVGCSARPVADAGAVRRTIVLGETASFSGANSTDAETPDGLVYSWSIVGVPAVQAPAFPAGSPTVAGAASLQPAGASAVTTADIAGADTDSASFVPDGVGEYSVRLTVHDGCQSDSVTTTLQVECAQAPTLSAPPVQAHWAGINGPTADGVSPQSPLADAGYVATLSSTTSPTPVASGVVYSWKWLAVPSDSSAAAVGQEFASADSASVTLDVAGVYVAQVSMSDGCYVVRAATSVVVGADVPLIMPRTGPYEAQLGGSVALGDVQYIDGRGEVVDSSYYSLSVSQVPAIEAISWVLVSAPAASASSGSSSAAALLSREDALAPTFTPDAVGTYVLRVTVSDGTVTGLDGKSSVSADVPVEVSCSQPPVPALTNQLVSVTLGEVATLSAAGSSDPDSSSLQYTWGFFSPGAVVRKPAGASVAGAASLQSPESSSLVSADIDRPAAGQASFVPDGIGTFPVQVTVSDGCSSASATAVVVAACPASPPVAAAGADLEYSIANATGLPLEVALDATAAGSAVPGSGGAMYVEWAIDSSPEGSAATLTSATSATAASLSVSAVGTYAIRLRVSDGCRVSEDVRVVTVLDASAPAPVCSPSATPAASATPTAAPTTSTVPVASASRSPFATPSPSATVAPSRSSYPSCAPVVASSTSSIVLSSRLGGVSPAELASDPELRSAFRREVASRAGVDPSAVVIISYNSTASAPATRRQLAEGDSTVIQFRIDQSSVTDTDVDALVAAVVAAHSDGTLAAALAGTDEFVAAGVNVTSATKEGDVVTSRREVVVQSVETPVPVYLAGTPNTTTVEVTKPLGEYSGFIALLVVAIVLAIVLVATIRSSGGMNRQTRFQRR